MNWDRFSGDPRLLITPNGANLDWVGGQPTMDQGYENQAILSLFTGRGWCGNLFLPAVNQVGSDFEDSCRSRGVTLQRLAEVRDAAVRALTCPSFGSLAVAVTNPKADTVRLSAVIGPGSLNLEATKAGEGWKAQASNPASMRLVNKS